MKPFLSAHHQRARQVGFALPESARKYIPHVRRFDMTSETNSETAKRMISAHLVIFERFALRQKLFELVFYVFLRLFGRDRRSYFLLSMRPQLKRLSEKLRVNIFISCVAVMQSRQIRIREIFEIWYLYQNQIPN